MSFFSAQPKNIIKKVSLSFGFLFLIGAFVYAAGGPFTPGFTLDPTCDPYISPGVPDTNCVVTAAGGGGMVIGDPVTNSDKGSIFFSDGNNNLGQDISNFFWDEKNKLLGVGTSSPGARIHSDGKLATVSDISKPVRTVNNSSYDKLSLNGTYNGSTSSTWIIQIVDDSVDPQLFRYSTDNGSTWSGDLPITSGYSSLQDGVEAGFGTTTGYTNGDEWQFDVTAGGGSDIDALLLSVNGFEEMRVGKNGIRFYDAYTFPGQDGNSGDVLTANGNGELTWQAPGGGGGSSSLGANAIGFGNGSNVLAGDINNLFWDYQSNRMAIGSSSASASLDIFSSSYNQTTDTSSWQASTQCTNCVNTLNDLNLSSTGFFGAVDEEFKIVIASTGSPDTFDWYIDNNIQQSGIPITGGTQHLTNIADSNDWIEVWFNNTTGHTNGTEWLIQGVTKKGGSLSGPNCSNCTADLNDISVDTSVYNDSVVKTYTITIDSVGVTDTYSWTNDGGSNFITNVPITAGQYVMFADGLQIRFDSDTGHTLGTSWDIDVTYQNSSSTSTYKNDPFQVRDQNDTVAFKIKKDGVISIKGVDYTFPTQGPSNGQVLTYNSGINALEWSTLSGGGGGSSLIGSTATSGTETWLGETAGGGSASYNSTVFIGENAGLAAVAAPFSTFIGVDAGSNASNATYSNFFGIGAGTGATLASNSVFIGTSAGASAASAARSIFIGNGAGSMDTVNNTFSVNDHSILIGDNSSTDGHSNSIALGTGATNTASNQFLIDDSYTQFNMRGINWTMPSSAGGVGQVLTVASSAASANVLEWATPSGGGGGSSLDGFTTTSNTALGVAAGANLSGNSGDENTYIGWGAGYANHDGLYNTAIGKAAGYGNNNGDNNIFLGKNAGYFGMNSNTSGSRNTLLGVNSGTTTSSATDAIALGYGAVAASNQFALSDDITSWKFQGDSYTLPTSDGTSGQALTTNGSGTLSWITPPDTDTNIYNTDGTLTSNRTIDADGNSFNVNNLDNYALYTMNNASNFTLSEDAFALSVGNSNTFLSANLTDMHISTDNLFLEAYDLLKIKTPSVNSASVGDVLTLQNVSTGEVEYQPISTFAWGKSGNAGTTAGTNFIGTTDAKDLVFKTNNSETARFKSNGNIELGSGASATGTLFGSSFAAMGGTASGGASFAFGASAVSSGPYSVATSGSVSSGQFSFATGRGTASGESSNSFGYGTLSKGFSETALGMSNTNYTPVGGQAPADRLFVVGNGDYGPSNRSDAFTILHNGQTGVGIDNFEANTNGNIFQVGNGSTGVIGYVNSGTGAWVTVSDARDKDNIEDLNYNIDTLMSLRPVSFDYKNNGEHTIGFVAQEAKDIVPESVFGSEDEKYGMSYSNLVPVTVKAIQDIFNLVDSFREKLVNWFADASNGITDFFAGTVHTKTLCVGDQSNETCITKAQLDSLLSGQSANTVSGGGGITTPDPDPIPDPAPEPSPDPAPASDPAPEPSPES